jgi:hypothetical protein
MSATAAGGSAREQQNHTWRAAATIEEGAADEVKRHYELLMENGGGLAWTAAEDVILMQANLDPRGDRGADMARWAGRKGGEAKAVVQAELD